ncbi:MAG: helix-turn-helix transcriptional regulator [Candidatus Heimdallarchaeota archaeon]|nr:helix-turn-helix transcriptional regulator [Candidatus Heimdallarchaeota archaeon]MCK4955471.1 helix-turn-helix transcriptional regulator [Candidatus Heimdallarchaeota archaeon]
MFRNIKTYRPEALIGSEQFRTYVESFESELLRGISTLSALAIIQRFPDEGIYGYQLLKELEKETQKILVIEEGTLYPMLRKLERDGLLTSEKKHLGGRPRKYYKLTDEGSKLSDHMVGFFSKLLEAISSLMEFKIELPEKKFVYCPNCANKIDLQDKDYKFCNICGLNIEGLSK